MKERKNSNSKNDKFEFFTKISKYNENNINNGTDLLITKNPFQKELIFFKNEILKEVNLLTKEILEKYEKHDLILNSETSKLKELIKNSEDKINNLKNLISINNQTQSVLETLTSFQKNTESYIITNDIRFSNLTREFSENISRYDNILKESVIYPGIIGPSAQFQNFHELIDYFLGQLTEVLKYKEKNTIDLIQYKMKLDNKLNKIKAKLDDFIDDILHKNKKEFNQMEAKINEFSIKIDEVVDTYKLENEKNLENISLKNKEFMEKIEENIKSINEENANIKNRLKKIAKKENKENKDLNDVNKKFSPFKKQNIIKGKSIANFKEIIDSNKIFNLNKNYENKIIKESSNSKKSTSRINNENNKNSNNDDNDSSDSKSKSKISNSINIEVKSIENRLKQFIKDELKKISTNNYNINYSISTNSIDKEKITKNSPSYNTNVNKKIIQKSLTNSAPFLPNMKINIINNKNQRQSFVKQNYTKENIFFENIFDKPEEKKGKKEYNFEKIKEVFIEESFESSGSYPEISKISEREKEKNRNNMSVTEENITLTLKQPEFKKNINYKKSYKSTTQLPILTKIKKTKKEKLRTKIKKIPEIINQRKTLNIKKTPIKRSSLKSLKSSMSFSSRKEKDDINNFNDVKKELFKQNSIKKNLAPDYKNKENIINFKDDKNEVPKKDLDKKIQNNIQPKKNIKINSPQKKNKPRLSNFAITLQGTQKLNINQINNLDKKHLFNSPTIYMNSQRKYSMYNEKVLESLHPVYRNRKFSSYITPYISLMTNNLQEMIRQNDKKSIEQRKRNLPWNRSDYFLLNKDSQTQTNPQNKENINKKKYNYKQFGNDNNIKLSEENDMIEFNKFSHLIMKDI